MEKKEDEEIVEVDFEIWPVEHPMEPPDEDRPVKCPMPADSSVINVSNFSSLCFIYFYVRLLIFFFSLSLSA